MKTMLATIPRAPPIGSKALLPDRTFIDWFRHYKPQEEAGARKFDIKKDKVLEQITEIFRSYKKEEVEFTDSDGYSAGNFLEWEYDTALELVKKVNCTSRDITNFSMALTNLQHDQGFDPEKIGHFLSALINNCKDKEFTIFTESLGGPGFLSYENTKFVTIIGNVGRDVGFKMKSGKIVVQGNAGYHAGNRMERGSITVKGDAENDIGYRMRGGSITIEGNAEDNVGYEMHGGEITVNGNAGYAVGWDMGGGKIIVGGNVGGYTGQHMRGGSLIVEGDAGERVGDGMGFRGRGDNKDPEGGEIHLNGKYSSLADNIRRGNIYHKGKLIVKDGKRV